MGHRLPRAQHVAERALVLHRAARWAEGARHTDIVGLQAGAPRVCGEAACQLGAPEAVQGELCSGVQRQVVPRDQQGLRLRGLVSWGGARARRRGHRRPRLPLPPPNDGTVGRRQARVRLEGLRGPRAGREGFCRRAALAHGLQVPSPNALVAFHRRGAQEFHRQRHALDLDLQRKPYRQVRLHRRDLGGGEHLRLHRRALHGAQGRPR
mmetsp:Transcript_40909/g.115725  ORF Transcript_40909/g.115725 Transcript_40909/m.115725 type:complete len:209 (+) Transcript_40909:223-849(+)